MRTDWHTYFINIAKEISKRATCDRKSVGAVIVRDNQILATGYNGSIKGAPHCDDVGHLFDDGHCVRTVHAEVNAICQAARNGVSIEGATMYTNTFPCWNCFKMIANAGIKKLFCGDEYRASERVYDAAYEANIEIFVKD